MGLPIIPALIPVIVPAQPQMEFNDAFVTVFNVASPSPTEPWPLSFSVQPYNQALQMLGPVEDIVSLVLDDALAYALKFPAFASVLAATISLVPLIQAERQATANLALAIVGQQNARVTPDTNAQVAANAAVDAAKATLVGAESALGKTQ